MSGQVKPLEEEIKRRSSKPVRLLAGVECGTRTESARLTDALIVLEANLLLPSSEPHRYWHTPTLRHDIMTAAAESAHSNVPPPSGAIAGSLPSELLEMIFMVLIRASHTVAGRPWHLHVCSTRCFLRWVQITHVCRHWRTTALAYSSLWTHPIFNLPHWVEEMMKRAGPHSSLTISVDTNTLIGPSQGAHSRLPWLIANLTRVRTLVLTDTGTNSSQITADALNEWRGDELSLEQLSLRCLPRIGIRPLYNTLPTHILRASLRLRSIHIHGWWINWPEHGPVLESLALLEELTVSHTRKELPHMAIRLPRLKRLHVAEGLDICLSLCAAIQPSSPLEYVGIDCLFSLGNIDGAGTRAMLSASRVVQDHSGVFPMEMLGYYSMFCFGADEAGATYQFAAWSKAAVERSWLLELFREGVLPPETTAQWYRAGDLTVSGLVHSSPSLYLACKQAIGLGDDPGDLAPADSVMSSLAETFSLRSALYARISVESTDLSSEGLCNLLDAMETLHMLEVRDASLSALAAALMPRGDGHIPVKCLGELVLRGPQLGNEIDLGMYCFLECLSARSASVSCSGLKKLTVHAGNDSLLTHSHWNVIRESGISVELSY
ncbi:hypothetical protein CONPUDRAFT_167369 [Coniophora puteana RWD-64-598 SS2]|uniref:Uncharacterized protein n=1 Tax=Coniophora puteana (strain RWD-64-598) TaxID=741705 RepID=A0A5M3MGH0_CONPW|nr:uncharacterized protein CONPUDRAFT_167369 [Coniophora puteana RWD-64-598 SS2]EIW78338.1 hypothetical protein CONPUDRAFT_167369 [Coniophora puteana RWD-64-598 SS2]